MDCLVEWSKADAISSLITDLSKRLDDKEIEDNKDLIAKGIEMNPRQVKRLINRFILARSANHFANRVADLQKSQKMYLLE